MQKFLCLALMLLLCLSAQSQELYTPDAAATLPKPHYIIKWAPLSAIDIDPTVQFGLEYLLKGNWSIQQELGYGHFKHGNNAWGSAIWNKEVWRSRSELRLYLSKQQLEPKGAYAAIEFLYKRVNFNENSNIGRDCEDGGCAYFERVEYKVLRDVTGYHLKIGAQGIIAKRFALDMYLGLGRRHIFVKTPGKTLDSRISQEEPRGDELIDLGIYPTEAGRYMHISANLGFKVGYLLYKR